MGDLVGITEGAPNRRALVNNHHHPLGTHTGPSIPKPGHAFN